MEGPHALREKAKSYRRLALIITDKQAVEVLHELAEEYEALAIQLEAAVSSCSSSEN